MIDGFTNGFSIGYEGDPMIRQTSPNLKFRGVGNKTVLWNKVMKEVKLKRFAGPFKKIPYEHYIQSPIGLVSKDHGRDTRLIFHLSYPRGTGRSLNSNTPKHKCTVKYPTFDDAVRLCIKAGKSCTIAKSDMKSAFRNICIKIAHFRFLLMKAESPLDNKTYYFVDKCLPFGAAISCALFQAFSDAIAHIVTYLTGEDNINYLDDYLFAALLKALCNNQVKVFLEVCHYIKFPVAIEKTFWASTQLVFLGILIDTVLQIVCIPQEKIHTAVQLISETMVKKKLTLKQLLKICGFFNFLGKCVVPGRAFTRRLYAHTSNPKLKPNHHIRISREMRLDLQTWLTFLKNPIAYARPFMDFTMCLTATEIRMFSDSAKNRRLGFGAICDTSWSCGVWGSFIDSCNPSIQYLELYAVTVAVVSWIHRFKNSRIILFCDNDSVCKMINKTSSSCKQCMVLIRIIVLQSLINNVRIFAKHIGTKLNRNADLLSRGKMSLFFRTNNGNWDDTPTDIPKILWPIEKLWLN